MWLLAKNDEILGPYRFEEVVDFLNRGQVTLAHYIKKEEDVRWARIVDVGEFQSLIPQIPRLPDDLTPVFTEAAPVSEIASSQQVAVSVQAPLQASDLLYPDEVAPQTIEDRRASVRRLVSAQVHVTNGVEVYKGVSLEMSGVGARIQVLHDPFRVGTEVRFNFAPIDLQSPGFLSFTGMGVVVRCDPGKKEMSLRFLKLSAESRKNLEGLLSTSREKV